MKYSIRFIVCCAILYLNASFSGKEKKDFTVISYNVWNGFESQDHRRAAFVQWAKQQNADVIAFEELNNFTQASFSQLANSFGHPYAVISKEKGYPVGISSRYPIQNVYKLMKGMHHGCLYAEIKGISFFVVHFSPFSSAFRLQEADSVAQVLQKRNKLNGQAIVLGDFNAFSPKDSLFYNTSAAKDSMYVEEMKNSKLRNLNKDNNIDYQVISRFLENGFYDSFSLFHKTFQSSYPSKAYALAPVSSQCRIDHMLISQKIKTKCKGMEIIKDVVTDTLSDHYLIKLRLLLGNK